MGDVMVLAEHRRGELRDISLEMLSAAPAIADHQGGSVVSLLLGSGVDALADKLSRYSDRVLYVDDPLFSDYNSENYQKVLYSMIQERKPQMVMIGHTAQGVDMAPALAVELAVPFLPDVMQFDFSNGTLIPVRQFYQGKVNADYAFKAADTYLITVREAAFTAEDGQKKGDIEKVESPLKEGIEYRRFIEYIEPIIGDVDITQSEVLIGVGRGVREDKNLPLVEGLAEALGADLCGSRAAIDSGWLGIDRQVGTSGKTVKPKLYIAVGISGAFQHLAGMKGAKTVVAINKDPEAPIFSVADYGIVDDLFKVLPGLTEKLKELKG